MCIFFSPIHFGFDVEIRKNNIWFVLNGGSEIILLILLNTFH